jgi:sortase A
MKIRKLKGILHWVLIAAGAGLLLYPFISNAWNSFCQSKEISSYEEKSESLDDTIREQMWRDATEYNKGLIGNDIRYELSEEDQAEYESLLDITGDGLMGYVEVPTAGCYMPIYHGTEEPVLQDAAGHLSGSSLPVGGESTHCVLVGHRGLPGVKLFTDLDEVVEGDIFTIHVLNQTLTYEVDEIQVVLPEEVEALEIEDGEDKCTLVTCTPYGVNTHRLLVTGHRIPNLEDEEDTHETMQRRAEIRFEAIIVVVVLILILLIVIKCIKVRKAKKKKKQMEASDGQEDNT